MHRPPAHIQDSWAMSKRTTKLSRDILKSICDVPGQTLAQIAERFSGRADKTTVRRNVYKLGAMGYLSLRDEAVISPTEKGRALLTSELHTSEGSDAP